MLKQSCDDFGCWNKWWFIKKKKMFKSLFPFTVLAIHVFMTANHKQWEGCWQEMDELKSLGAEKCVF